jgi:hypothetical protein
VVVGSGSGFYDHGTSGRISSLYRMLFDAAEISALAQDARRAAEMFAQAYPRLFLRSKLFDADDAAALLTQWERHESSILLAAQRTFNARVLDLYHGADRRHVRKFLVDEYRRFLAIPKFQYVTLNRLLDEIDEGRNPGPR